MVDRDETPIKFGIQLPPWYEARLRVWARIKGTNRATLAANILQSRLEANKQQIDEDLEAAAKWHGITVDELIRRWSNEDAD